MTELASSLSLEPLTVYAVASVAHEGDARQAQALRHVLHVTDQRQCVHLHTSLQRRPVNPLLNHSQATHTVKQKLDSTVPTVLLRFCLTLCVAWL